MEVNKMPNPLYTQRIWRKFVFLCANPFL